MEKERGILYNDAFEKTQGTLTTETAYWLGFLTGDGSIGYYGNGRYRLGISLKRDDKKHLEKLAEFLGYKKDRVKDVRDAEAQLLIDNKKLYQDLQTRNFEARKSRKTGKHMVPTRNKRHYFRGLFDADGTVCIYDEGNTDLSFYGHRPLLKEVKKFLNIGGSLYDSQTCFRLHYSGLNQQKFIFDKLYTKNCVCLERKYKIFQTISNL